MPGHIRSYYGTDDLCDRLGHRISRRVFAPVQIAGAVHDERTQVRECEHFAGCEQHDGRYGQDYR